jgi:hypothetical protein
MPDPDFTVTTDDLTASGDLVDLRPDDIRVWLDRDVTGDHNTQQVTHASKALWDALRHYGAFEPVFEALLRFIADCAFDTAEEGEPTGQHLATPTFRALDGRPVWFQRNGEDTWTAMFPLDY